MGYYTITSSVGNGLRLNVDAIALLDTEAHIDVSTVKVNDNQKWIISSLGSNADVRSVSNAMFSLGASAPSYSAVCVSAIDVGVNFVKVNAEVYRLQLGSDEQKYLTLESNSSPSKVYWDELNEDDAGQLWVVTPTTCDYIRATSWLKMYTSQTGTNGRTVNMPTVPSFTGPDGYTYSFTNKNYWYAYENPYGSNRINPYAISQIYAVTGKNPVINVGSEGEYTDSSGNYWMAVGPNVVNPNHKSNEEITASEMYAKGKLDVVVKDAYGTSYYIPAVVGDAKAHTWSNGIIQTYRSYPNGTITSAGANFNGLVCAEFIGALGGKLTGLGSYSIDKILFYAS